MEFKDRLIELRKAKGLTQEKLASLFYVSRQLVAKWEEGSLMPGFLDIKRLASYFNVTALYLLNGIE